MYHVSVGVEPSSLPHPNSTVGAARNATAASATDGRRRRRPPRLEPTALGSFRCDATSPPWTDTPCPDKSGHDSVHTARRRSPPGTLWTWTPEVNDPRPAVLALR